MTRFSGSFCNLISLTVLALCCSAGFASTTKIIHDFIPLAKGANPDSSLISDAAGNLYGTTSLGGPHSQGEVYELVRQPSGSYTTKVLYGFYGGQNDGALPQSPLVFDAVGNLYGTTVSGGPTSCGNCGAVFKLSPGSGGTWTETILFFFQGGSTGSRPTTGVTLDASGNLFGVCANNSPAGGYGLVYKLSPSGSSWTQTILWQFTGGADGAYPSTPVVFDAAGNLYGGSENTNFIGEIYKLPSGGGALQVIHAFAGYPRDGGLPRALIMDGSGNLFGATQGGGSGSSGGVVFEMSPGSGGTWTETVLHNFGVKTNEGTVLYGTIALDAAGNIYGSTFGGGATGNGTVYQLHKNSKGIWVDNVLHSFYSGGGGVNPQGGVSFDAFGNLTTTTFSGGSTACAAPYYAVPGCGVAVVLTPSSSFPWTTKVISDFISTDSASPQGQLLGDGSGGYYGTANLGGKLGQGEVFHLTQSAGVWSKSTLYTFTGVSGDGANPSGNLLLDASGNLYGTTQYGGVTPSCNFALQIGCGVVYELSPTGSGPWTEKILYTFNYSIGGNPNAGLTRDGAGDLYGTATDGGGGGCSYGQTAGCGIVFELTPSGGGTWTETTLYEFNGNSDGGNSLGTVYVDGSGNVFGTTYTSGNLNAGTAFELSPASGGIYTFNLLYTYGSASIDPTNPTTGFLADGAGNLYGGSYGSEGSTFGSTVYKFSQSGGIWSTGIAYGFGAPPDGASLWGNLTFDNAGNLFGTTLAGGAVTGRCPFLNSFYGNGCGTVFELSPSTGGTWTETQLHSFTGHSDGSTPMAGVTLDGSGNVFVSASEGGTGQSGTIIEVLP